MLALHPDYLVGNDNKTKAVMIPFNEWEQVLEELELLEDIRCYDECKKNEEEFVPFERALEEMGLG